jgi:predicted Zn-dependent protease
MALSLRARRAALAFGLAAATGSMAACGDISAPARTAVYEWRLFGPKATGSGLDTLSFRWPAASQPVRIYAQDSIGMRDHTQHAIDAWQAAFLYREWRAQLVDDSTTAQIIVRPVVAIPSDSLAPIGLQSMANECTGLTTLDLDAAGDTLHLPIRIFIQPRFDVGVTGVSTCLDLTTIHEMGHAIGIWNHSPDAGDIMFGNPVVTVPSDRDRLTAERAYHVPSNVVPSGRP